MNLNGQRAQLVIEFLKSGMGLISGSHQIACGSAA
jgi:hypothetical protein